MVGALIGKLVGNVGYAMRKSRRLPPGPRRDLVVESLAVALNLLSEMADPTPELVRMGGLDLLGKPYHGVVPSVEDHTEI